MAGLSMTEGGVIRAWLVELRKCLAEGITGYLEGCGKGGFGLRLGAESGGNYVVYLGYYKFRLEAAKP